MRFIKFKTCVPILPSCWFNLPDSIVFLLLIETTIYNLHNADLKLFCIMDGWRLWWAPPLACVTDESVSGRYVDAAPDWAKQLEADLPAGKTTVTFVARSPLSDDSAACSFTVEVRGGCLLVLSLFICLCLLICLCLYVCIIENIWVSFYLCVCVYINYPCSSFFLT